MVVDLDSYKDSIPGSSRRSRRIYGSTTFLQSHLAEKGSLFLKETLGSDIVTWQSYNFTILY